MNFARVTSPCFGSGLMSRLMARLCRIGVEVQSGSLFGSLHAVARAAPTPAIDALRVVDAADDVVPHARKVLHATPADHHDGVLLEVVADARDVCRHFHAVRKADTGDLPERRVRLLRGHGSHLHAHAALECGTTRELRLP